MGTTHPDEVPMNNESDTETTAQNRPSPKPMHLAMIACCFIMLIPIAGYFLASGALSGFSGNLVAFAPLLLCVGAHFVMHKVMGKSCHASDKQDKTAMSGETVRDVESAIPQVRRG